MWANKLKSWFYEETWAIPLDLFRIAFGVLCICYFYALFNQIPDFSSQNGLINHDYFLKHWWYLNINLIPSDPSDLYFKGIIGSAFFLSFFLVLGIYPRIVSFFLFFVASTVQKWNYAVIYVDDVTMHLVLFWLMLLPSGRTLSLLDYIKEGSKSYHKWLNLKIPAIGIKLFLLNVCWIYFYAGMEKVFSEMWYRGFAMYPILLIPISRVSDFIKPEYYPAIVIITYASLAVEIILPFMLLSRKGSTVKWVGLLFMVSFHVFIISTLRIPFANFALLGSAVLFFREELMDFVHSKSGLGEQLGKVKKLSYSGIFSIIFFILVITSTMRFIPYINVVSGIPTKVLWSVGVIQNYQLFDWIDRFNYKIEYKVYFRPVSSKKSEMLDHTDFLPNSVRYTLFQLRLYDIRWILRISGEKRKELREDIPYRIASKYCRQLNRDGEVNIIVTMKKITFDNIDMKKLYGNRRIRFVCGDEKVTFYKLY